MTENFSGVVEIFPECDTPWWFVNVPTKISRSYKPLAGHFGFIAITISVGKSSWQSSLLPNGDGEYIIALPAKIRKANNIQLGDKISIEFEPRER
jgi:Domain of unknown function (DUF1905).